MKKAVSLILILAVCLFWTVLPVQGEEESGTGQGIPIFVEPADVVAVGPEHERTFELSQNVIDWWKDIHTRRSEVETDIYRPQVGFNDYPTPPPPTTEEFLINDESFQPNAFVDFKSVIKHTLTSTENPNVTNDSNPSVGFAQMKKGFMVYKQGAARSEDHGNSWTPVTPYIGSPGSPWFYTGKQEVIYDPLYNVHLWVQLWGHNDGGGLIRLGVGRNTTSWCWYTLYSSTTTLPDDPHIRLGHNLFYITFDEYTSGGSIFHRGIIQRWPIAHFMRCGGAGGSYFFDNARRGFMVAKNSGYNSTMYAVSNGGSIGKIKIVRWHEADNSFNWWEITINNWNYGSSNFTCNCPDGKNPCARYSQYDDRVRAAVVTKKWDYPESSKNQLWVSFNVGKDTLNPNMPYTYLVKIDVKTMNVLGYHHIRYSQWAFQNLDMVPNADGDIGMIIDLLGGTYYTAVMVAILDNDIQDYGFPFSWHSHASGSPCPSDNKWSHNNSINLWWRNQFQFTGVGHVMTGSGPRNVYQRFTNEKYFP